MRLRISFQSFRAIHAGMFGQMLVMQLFQRHNILSQMCGNNFMVLKVAPPLVITEAQLEKYINSVEAVMEEVHSSSNCRSDAMKLAQRDVRI